ncbi:MAG TPA: MFS transporter [Polyangia bacterium]|jgi:MFS family permease|nr:MFS transporter [Polyangia bacterium]
MSQVPAVSLAAPHDPYAPLRLPGFRWFVVSVLTMAMGAQIQGVVVAWQMYALTHDPLALGMVGLAEALPFVSLALPAGHVADLHDRRRIALTALVALFGCSLALAALSTLAAHVSAARLGVYAIIVGCGVARSFLLPARNALASEVVPRPLYASSVAWRTGIWQVAAVSGPAVGGVLYAWVGPTASYLVAASLMAFAFGAVARVRVVAARARTVRSDLLTSVREGIVFLLERRLFLGAMTLDLLAVLFGGATALLPIFAEQILHSGPRGLGVLRAAPAIGAVLMSMFLALRPPHRRAGPKFLAAVAIFGVTIVGFALSRSFVLSVFLLALGGAADMLSINFRSTMVQVLVPPEMLGRVSSVNQIFIGSSNEIGAFESGVAARLLGTVPSVVLGGVITIAVALGVAWRIPELRRLDRIEGEVDVVPGPGATPAPAAARS